MQSKAWALGSCSTALRTTCLASWTLLCLARSDCRDCSLTQGSKARRGVLQGALVGLAVGGLEEALLADGHHAVGQLLDKGCHAGGPALHDTCHSVSCMPHVTSCRLLSRQARRRPGVLLQQACQTRLRSGAVTADVQPTSDTHPPDVLASEAWNPERQAHAMYAGSVRLACCWERTHQEWGSSPPASAQLCSQTSRSVPRSSGPMQILWGHCPARQAAGQAPVCEERRQRTLAARTSDHMAESARVASCCWSAFSQQQRLRQLAASQHAVLQLHPNMLPLHANPVCCSCIARRVISTAACAHR